MDQYSINIPGNSGSVNISFEELSYKLLNDEIIIGQNSDFPTKKDISLLISLQDKFYADSAFEEIVNEVKPTADYNYALDTWIENNFGADSPNYNLGVRFFIDAHISFNHRAVDGSLIHHYAGTYFKRFSFTAYRTKVSGNDFYFSAIDKIVQNGVWVEYNSAFTDYASVANDGELSDGAFTFTIDSSNRLIVGCNLRNETGFESDLDYECDLILKIDAHELSVENYTTETV
jgi:hypothetical protein